MKGYIATAIVVLCFVLACNDNKTSDGQKNDSAKNADSAVEKKTIVFFGNSLTAGYGLSPSEAFPAIIQNKIDSLGLTYKVINAGVSGETSSTHNRIIPQPVTFRPS